MNEGWQPLLGPNDAGEMFCARLVNCSTELCISWRPEYAWLDERGAVVRYEKEGECPSACPAPSTPASK